MRRKHFYLLMCLLGIAIPYCAFVPWLFQPGAGPAQFVRDLFANRVSAFFALDLLLSAVVVLSFIRSENKRRAIRNMWIPVLATICVGVSLGFPLFLYLREDSEEEA